MLKQSLAAHHQEAHFFLCIPIAGTPTIYFQVETSFGTMVAHTWHLCMCMLVNHDDIRQLTLCRPICLKDTTLYYVKEVLHNRPAFVLWILP